MKAEVKHDGQFKVLVKCHRHLIEILLEEETDAYELEWILKAVKKIKIRRYGDEDRDSNKGD